MRASFGRVPFALSHRLAGHPLLELPRLAKLAQELPQAQVEYNPGDVPVSLDPKRTPRNGLSPEETVRRIEECKSWLVLKNPGIFPEYAELLEDCLEEIAA